MNINWENLGLAILVAIIMFAMLAGMCFGMVWLLDKYPWAILFVLIIAGFIYTIYFFYKEIGKL